MLNSNVDLTIKNDSNLPVNDINMNKIIKAKTAYSEAKQFNSFQKSRKIITNKKINIAL